MTPDIRISRYSLIYCGPDGILTSGFYCINHGSSTGGYFPDITTAKIAIKAFVAANGKTSKTVKSDKTRVLLACKSNSYRFRIRTINSKKKGVSITHLEPHNCNPATHYIAPNTKLLASTYICISHLYGVDSKEDYYAKLPLLHGFRST